MSLKLGASILFILLVVDSSFSQSGMYHNKKSPYSLFFIEETDSVLIAAKRSPFICRTTYRKEGENLLVNLTNCGEEFISIGKRQGFETIKIRNERIIVTGKKRFKKRKGRRS